MFFATLDAVRRLHFKEARRILPSVHPHIRSLWIFTLVVIAAACSPDSEEFALPATFDLHHTPKQDCGGRRTCRISYQVAISSDGSDGYYDMRCQVRALDDEGHVVASGDSGPSGTEEGDYPFTRLGMVPYEGDLSPKVRRTITTIEGTCLAFPPAQG
jgi:hypothetical protein